MSERAGQRVSIPEPPRSIPGWFILRRMRAMFFCGLLFTALGVGLGTGLVTLVGALSGWTSPLQDLALDRRHEVTTATVLEKELVRQVHVNSKHPWKVRFRFADASDRSVEAVGFTYDQALGGKGAGDPLQVEYHPADPAVARPVGGSVALVPLWAYVLIVGVLGAEGLIGVALLVLVWRRSGAERVLLAYGAGAEAEVTGVRRVSHIRFHRRNPHDVYYQFTDHYGRRVAGRDRTYHYAWAEACKAGDRVGVVYNPRASGVNVLWLHGGERE